MRVGVCGVVYGIRDTGWLYGFLVGVRASPVLVLNQYLSVMVGNDW